MTKISKISKNSCSETLTALFNITVLTGNFPTELKLANVTPVFEKANPLKLKKYKPVSELPALSKILKIMYKQMSIHVDNVLLLCLCEYRGFGCSFIKKGYGRALLMELSKVFYTLNHNLLIAKLHASGFTRESVKLIKSCLRNHWQTAKVNTNFSSWSELLIVVPQGSVLGALIFNIYINDLFKLLKLQMSVTMLMILHFMLVTQTWNVPFKD